jgi:hypothetical protein
MTMLVTHNLDYQVLRPAIAFTAEGEATSNGPVGNRSQLLDADESAST